MSKFWVFVLISLVQVAMVLTFIFPDDDYFKEEKPTGVPSYATDGTLNRFTTRRTPTTPRLTRFTTRRTPTTTRRSRFTTRPTPTTDVNDIENIEIEIEIFNACMKSCPTTTEYDPICGDDRLNYPNKSTLKCVRRCGVEVEIGHLGRC